MVRSKNSDILLPRISDYFRIPVLSRLLSRVLSRVLSRALILSELVVGQISRCYIRTLDQCGILRWLVNGNCILEI